MTNWNVSQYEAANIQVALTLDSVPFDLTHVRSVVVTTIHESSASVVATTATTIDEVAGLIQFGISGPDTELLGVQTVTYTVEYDDGSMLYLPVGHVDTITISAGPVLPVVGGCETSGELYYDTEGRLSAVTRDGAQLTMTYDEDGKLSTVQGYGHTTTMVYSTDGTLTSFNKTKDEVA